MSCHLTYGRFQNKSPLLLCHAPYARSRPKRRLLLRDRRKRRGLTRPLLRNLPASADRSAAEDVHPGVHSDPPYLAPPPSPRALVIPENVSHCHAHRLRRPSTTFRHPPIRSGRSRHRARSPDRSADLSQHGILHLKAASRCKPAPCAADPRVTYVVFVFLFFPPRSAPEGRL